MRPEFLLVSQQHRREQRPSIDQRSTDQRMRAVGGEEVRRFLQEPLRALFKLRVPFRITLADDPAPKEREISERPEVVIIVDRDLRIVAVPAVIAGNEQHVQRFQILQHPSFVAFELRPPRCKLQSRRVIQRAEPCVVRLTLGHDRAARQPVLDERALLWRELFDERIPGAPQRLGNHRGFDRALCRAIPGRLAPVIRMLRVECMLEETHQHVQQIDLPPIDLNARLSRSRDNELGDRGQRPGERGVGPSRRRAAPFELRTVGKIAGDKIRTGAQRVAQKTTGDFEKIAIEYAMWLEPSLRRDSHARPTQRTTTGAGSGNLKESSTYHPVLFTHHYR